MSRTLSTNRGSADSLKVSLRWGWRENARQMRCTVEIDKPEALAIERVLQWVAAAGIVSNVVVTTSAIFSSPILRGAPGRGSSARPSNRLAANRWRQVATVRRLTPSCAAIARLVVPSAAEKHDLGTHRVSTRDLPATCPRLKLTPLGLIQLDANRRFPRHPHLPDRH